MSRRRFSPQIQRLGFTKAQHGKFRPMVEKAWTKYIASLPLMLRDRAEYRGWYEDELRTATGKTSTTACDPKRDFEDAMEHFERLADDGIYWALRKYGADARRIAHNIREVCGSHEVDEDYMRGIARRALKLRETDPLPELASLSYEQLRVIMGELKRFLTRGGRPRVHQKEFA
jgi:hypothetical protein